MWLAALAFIGGTLISATASAHGRSLSYSNWRPTDQGADVQVRISLLELTRLGIELPMSQRGLTANSPEPAGQYLVDRLRLSDANGPCAVQGPPRFRPSNEGWVTYSWGFLCTESGPRWIESEILLDAAPSHLHFARATTKAGGVRERVLVESSPRWRLAEDSTDPGGDSIGSSFGDYVILGAEHILSGWDHLAFVFALVLMASRLGEVAKLVTGFTIAHSLTLALAVLGWVQPVAHAVEAVIGFSVALIAAENTWLLSGRTRAIPAACLAVLLGVGLAGLATPASLTVLTLSGLALFTVCHFGLLGRSPDNTSWRVALAFAFGLVHGFGFAGVLAEMSLPTERLVPALLGFNVGVELGQLAVVALIWPALLLLRRRGDGQGYRWTLETASAAICGLGLFWFVTRALGLA